MTAADGGQIANSNTWGDGYGIGLTAATDMGLTVGAYYATRENKNHNAVADVNDETNMSGFVNFSTGPVSIGYQQFYVDSGLAGSSTLQQLLQKQLVLLLVSLMVMQCQLRLT